MNVLGLCAGAAGLELGLRAVADVRVVAYLEREAAALEVLLARMQEGALDEAPIWSDLCTFDGRPWRGVVDLVAAGFPCQPVSVAGKRLGADDERWLWDEVWRITCEVEAGLLFVENVPGLLAKGGPFNRVLGALAEGGWVAEWDCVPASSVGAPHQRDRFFMLAAHPDGAGLRLLAERHQRNRRRERAAEREHAEPVHDGEDRPLADSVDVGLDDQAASGPARRDASDRGSERRCGSEDASPADANLLDGRLGTVRQDPGLSEGTSAGDVSVADANGVGSDQGQGRTRTKRRGRAIAGREGPADSDRRRRPSKRFASAEREGAHGRVVDRRCGSGRDDSDAQSEGLEGAGQGWFGAAPGWAGRPPPEPVIRGMDDGLAASVERDRLHVTGNGVVPQAAAQAFLVLEARLIGGDVA